MIWRCWLWEFASWLVIVCCRKKLMQVVMWVSTQCRGNEPKLWMESLPCPALACQHLHNRAVCWVLFKLRPASGDKQPSLSQPSPDPSTCSNWRFARRILCCSFERFSKWLFETAKDLQPPCFCFQNWRKLPLCKIPTNLLSRPFRSRGKSLSQPARPRKLK